MYWTESLRYNFFLDSKLIAMLDAAVCSIKELHHVKIQCNSDGSTYDAYVSCLIYAASQYNSAPFIITEMEIIQSTPTSFEPVLSAMESQTERFILLAIMERSLPMVISNRSLVLWSLLNVNHEYILMNDLYHSVLCDPRSHTDSVFAWTMGGECTELPPMDCDCNIL